MKSKKITHLAKYYSPRIGGVETHLQKINQILVKKGYQVTVLTLQHDPKLPLEEKINGVRVVRIPYDLAHLPLLNDRQQFVFGHNLIGKFFYKIKLWSFIAKHSRLLTRANIIQIHDVFWWIWPLYPTIAHKVFTTFHGWEGEFPVRWQVRLQRQINAWSSKKTMHVGGFIEEFYGDKPDLITYGGVDIVKNKKDSSDKKKQTQVVFLGRLEKENEVKKTLELIRLWQKSNPNLEITFVGDGKFRKECEVLGKVTGFVSSSKVKKYLQKADLVFASSYLSILEAQAMGKRVSAFYSHLLKQRYLETFPGSKYMILAEDPAAMWVKIEENFKLSSAQQKALQTKIQKFAQTQSWENVVSKYEQLWSVNIVA